MSNHALSTQLDTFRPGVSNEMLDILAEIIAFDIMNNQESSTEEKTIV